MALACGWEAVAYYRRRRRYCFGWSIADSARVAIGYAPLDSSDVEASIKLLEQRLLGLRNDHDAFTLA